METDRFQTEDPNLIAPPPAEPPAEKKTTDKRKYMREYKQKAYAENPDKIKELNRMYYAKNKYNISDEDCKKYKELLPIVVKLNNSLEQISNIDKALLKSLLAKYI